VPFGLPCYPLISTALPRYCWLLPFTGFRTLRIDLFILPLRICPLRLPRSTTTHYTRLPPRLPTTVPLFYLRYYRLQPAGLPVALFLRLPPVTTHCLLPATFLTTFVRAILPFILRLPPVPLIRYGCLLLRPALPVRAFLRCFRLCRVFCVGRVGFYHRCYHRLRLRVLLRVYCLFAILRFCYANLPLPLPTLLVNGLPRWLYLHDSALRAYRYVTAHCLRSYRCCC